MNSASPTGHSATRPGQAKQRLDRILVERGLVESIGRAQALVMSGKVFSGETRLDKPGQQVSGNIEIDHREKEHPWVSRGGMKLAHALEFSGDRFGLTVEGRVCLDVGATTDGFTDVLL